MSKSAKIEIRLSEEAKANLQKVALERNISVSELLRQEIEKVTQKEVIAACED